jgi:predicted RNA polymerase sigma factor
VPDNPGAWLLTTARHKAIDQIRRDNRFEDRLPILTASLDEPEVSAHGSTSTSTTPCSISRIWRRVRAVRST